MRGLRDVSLVSAARYLSEVLYLARGILVAGLLGPYAFGIWSSMRIVSRFIPYFPLGSLEGMLQLAPYLDARGDHQAANDYRRTALGLGLITGLLAGVLIALFAWAAPPSAAANAWLIFALVLILEQIYDVQFAILRSQQDFVTVSVAMVGFALCSTVGGSIAAWGFGLLGFLVAMCASYAAVISIVFGAARIPISVRLESDRVKKLIGTGATILMAQALLTSMHNVDKFMLFVLLGNTALGLYAVPSYVVDLALVMPLTVGMVAYPQLLAKVARSDSPVDAWPYLERLTVIVGLVACPILGLLFLTVHLPIEWWLPEYIAAIEPGRILILIAFLPMIAALPATVLLSLAAYRTLIAIRLAALGVSSGTIAATIAGGGGLREVALATIPGFFLLAITTLLTAFRHSDLPRDRRMGVLRSVFGTYALLCALLLTFGTWGPESEPFWVVLTRIAAVCGPLCAWSAYSARRMGMFTGQHKPV